MPRRKKPRYHYGALVPHTGNKGYKVEYASNRIRVSVEWVANVMKYREWRRLKNGDWRFTRSSLRYNPDEAYIKSLLYEFRNKVEQDIKKVQDYLNTKGG
jgi:hypothetical protein